jgi:hypothetical protein
MHFGVALFEKGLSSQVFSDDAQVRGVAFGVDVDAAFLISGYNSLTFSQSSFVDHGRPPCF